MEKFTAIILAAGKGTRMKSTLPKVLHLLLGRPLIYYVLRELFKAKQNIKQIIVVVGYERERVEAEVKRLFIKKYSGIRIDFVNQKKRLGTADAVSAAIKKVAYENILVACGDSPLLTAATFKKFISFYLKKNKSCSLLSAFLEKSNSLGRIIRDKDGCPQRVKEKVGPRCCGQDSGKYEEANSGVYCFKRESLAVNLKLIKKNPVKKEYFLTDIIEVFYRNNKQVNSYTMDSGDEISGVNSQKDLWKAEDIMRQRIMEEVSARGVAIIDPKTTYIEEGVKIGKNSVIYPFTFIEKGVIIGNNCSVGPFVRLRGKAFLADNTQVGNFLEINRTRVGKSVKIKHFGYLGDASIADNVNIGAGTVIANFDGKNKHKTIIGKGSFIGSDTVLVAPVKLGKNSATGAGSVVTKNVTSGTTVVGVPARVLKKKRR
ncbi:MAG: NTP transferase domain-containing protein [Candidatus Omnitrophica bacterium]|nr:NTP transferase domain-containing protein [Candidatus Omnitrophota bacterium]MDD5429844.1 NTP transferase domain-containing protein [Candidatus Omnitrophota bacterium]